MPGKRRYGHARWMSSSADGRTTLLLTGEFDASCVLRFERLVRAAMDDPLPYLVIDMREVTFIDSTGLALLLRTEAASRQDGFELQILRSPGARGAKRPGSLGPRARAAVRRGTGNAPSCGRSGQWAWQGSERARSCRQI